MLQPALGSLVKERRGLFGESLEEIHENYQRNETPLLQGKTESVGGFQPGEDCEDTFLVSYMAFPYI